jgi:type I restriction enzyme S subunit
MTSTRLIPIVNLGDVVNFEGGGTPSKANDAYWNGTIPWASVKDISGPKLSSTIDYITKEGLANSASRLVPAGNVILPTRMALGRAAINTVDVAINQDLRVAYPHKNLDRRYLLWFIISNARLIESLGSGATVKGITLDKLRSLQIPLPPLPEQKRIAAILDKADAIRRKLQQSLRLSDDFLRSVFLDMFGNPVTNKKGWPVHKSGDLFADKPRLGTTRPATGTGYLVVRVGEIGSENVIFSKCGRVEQTDEELRRFRLAKGDILIARAIGSRDQLGKCSFFTGHKEIVVGDSHVMRLRPDTKKCDPYWLYFLLSSPSGKALLQSKGGATAVQFNINGTQASDLDIPLPPMKLQSRFVDVANKARKEIEHTSGMYADAQSLFSSLQQRAFRGEL